MSKPVLLLAFANDREEGGQYLRNLPQELNSLRRALEKAEDQQLCEVVILPSATLDGLLATFQREKYRGRIAIFHYGGHAGSYELLLEAASGKTELAHGEGLIPFLASQKGLQLIFLNGCFSAQQAQALVQQGVPAVIGTANAVNDDIACELAGSFYKALGEGSPLDKAWQEARYKAQAREGSQDMNRYYDTRSIKLRAAPSQFPWEAYYRPGAEAVRDWNLPDAANDPYFGLPGIPSAYGYPEQPFHFLERYKKEASRIFFGRGSYIRDLYHRIHSPQAAPAILLYGQSGVGKSSLLEAGLFPRLEAEYDIRLARRLPETGLLGHLAEALELPLETDAAQLLRQWKQLEAQSGKKGIVIVLDQVEEVFTRPAAALPEELDTFLQAASAIFAQPDERPAGKLLLSYRKEYDPEIEKACRVAGLPKEKVFLERLGRKGVLEIVSGLSSNQQLQNKYRLEIEKGLPVIIADDLLEDKNSPIAPVLQIILTKLWQQQEDQDKRAFRIDDYQQLKKEGILLDDFFHQQMAHIRAWEKEIPHQVESSGLALDVLHYHTTALGTAESRSLESLRTHYQHQSDVLDQLIGQLQSRYLLASLGKDQTALAHDTLAPIIQKEIRDSDKPGQRALRILTAKMADYEISPERTYIDEEDLALVEQGAGGMRLWTEKEKAMVEKSRMRRAKLVAERKRNRRIKVGGVVAIALLAIVASFLAWQSSTQGVVNRLVSEALQEQETDATRAMRKVQEAWRVIDHHPFSLEKEIAARARRDIYSNNEFYFWEIPENPGEAFGKPVKSVSLSRDGENILAAVGKEALLWNFNQPETPQVFSHRSQVNTVAFSPDGQLILTAGDDSSAVIWRPDGMQFRVLPSQKERIKVGVFSGNGQRVLLGGHQGTVILWDFDQNGRLYQWQAHRKDSITALCFLQDENQVLTAGWEGVVYQWQWTGSKMVALDSFVYQARPTALDYDANSRNILIGYRDGSLVIRNLLSRQQKELKAHGKGINQAAFSPDGSVFLTAGNDYQIKLWSAAGNLLKTYKGHADFVESIGFDGDGRYFASGGADGRIKLWKRDSKVTKSLELNGLGIVDIDITSDGQAVLIGTGVADPYKDRDLQAAQKQAGKDTISEFPLLLWHPETQQLDTLGKHRLGISAVAVSPDDQSFLSGGRDGRLWVYSQKNVNKFELIGKEGITVQAATFLPNGEGIASAEDASSADTMGLVYFWDWEGNLVDVLYPKQWVNGLAFSPVPNKNQWLMACENGGNGSCYFLDNSQLEELSFSRRKIRSVAFSSDGKYFAVGESGKNAQVHVFETATRRPLKLKQEMTFASDNRTGGRAITDIAFSPDNRYVAAVAEGGLAKLFDLQQQGREVMAIKDFAGYDARSLAFLPPEGKWIVIGSRDGLCRFYRNIALGGPWF